MKQFIVDKQEIKKVKYEYNYHPYISWLSRMRSESKKLLEYFKQNEDAHSKLIGTSVTFESVIDQLKLELDSKKDFEEREKYLSMIEKDKEWLETIDLDNMTRKDFADRLNRYTKLSYQLHPEFKDQMKEMKEESYHKKKEKEYTDMMKHLSELTKKYNFILKTYQKVFDELTKRNNYPNKKTVVSELKYMKNLFALNHFTSDITDIKEMLDFKGVTDLDKEMPQYEKYFTFFDDLYHSLFDSSSQVEL